MSGIRPQTMTKLSSDYSFARRSVVILAAALVISLKGIVGSADAQTLAIQGDHFTVDGQARFLTFLSYFDAMRATSLAGDFAFIKTDAGFDGVRIFPNWWHYNGTPSGCPSAANDTLFANNGSIRGDNGDVDPPSGPLLRLHEVLRAAQAQRLIVDLSFARETVPAPGDLDVAEYTQALRRIAFLLREYRNVLIDIQNERDNGSAAMHLTWEQVRAIKTAIKEVDPTRVVTASNAGDVPAIAGITPATPNGDVSGAGGATGFTLLSEVDVVAYHDPRVAGWQDRTTEVVQQLRRIAEVSAKPVYLQEPTRWRNQTNSCGGAETTLQSDPDPAHFRTALQRAKEAGAAAWTFHTQRAFRLATGSLQQRITELGASDAERMLYLGGSGVDKLTATGGVWPVNQLLTVSVSGPGRVLSDLGGISCTSTGGTCSATFAQNTAVTFSTLPDAGARFDGWDLMSGEEPSCAGTPACQVIVRAPTSLGARFSVVPVESIEYYHTDALGSIRAVTGGAPTVWHDFLPFGERVGGSAFDPAVTRRLFAGNERDAETGFDYLGARFYASQTGRLTTVDPVQGALGDPQTFNRYAYARNNPLRYVDPTGRYDVDLACLANEKCKKESERFEEQRKRAMNSRSKEVADAAAAYGERDDHNGIVVNFLDRKGIESTCGNDAAGCVKSGGSAFSVKADGKSMQVSAKVFLMSGKDSGELQRILVHEGSHVQDRVAYVGSFSFDTQSFDAAKNVTVQQTEFKAYSIELLVDPSVAHPLRDKMPVLTDQKINDFLGKSDLYKTRLNNKMFETKHDKPRN
jgi:RHS repeat-associated protein